MTVLTRIPVERARHGTNGRWDTLTHPTGWHNVDAGCARAPTTTPSLVHNVPHGGTRTRRTSLCGGPGETRSAAAPAQGKRTQCHTVSAAERKENNVSTPHPRGHLQDGWSMEHDVNRYALDAE